MVELSESDQRVIYEVSDSIGKGFEVVTAELGRKNPTLRLLALISTPSVMDVVATLENDDLLRDLWDTGTLPKQEKFRACWAVWASTISNRVFSEHSASVQDDVLRIIASVFSQSYETLHSEVSAYSYALSLFKGFESNMILRIRLAKALGYPGVRVPEAFANVHELTSTNPELIPLIGLAEERVLASRVKATLDKVLDLINNANAGRGRPGGSPGSGCLLPITVTCALLLMPILGIAFSS